MAQLSARLVIVALAFVASGCVSADRPGPAPAPVVDLPPPVAGGPSTPQCNAAAAQAVVGSLANLDTTERAQALAGTQTVRVIGPGQPVTQDFRPDRLNLETDAGNVIVTVRCG